MLEIIFPNFKWRFIYMTEYVLDMSSVASMFLYSFHLLARQSQEARSVLLMR